MKKNIQFIVIAISFVLVSTQALAASKTSGNVEGGWAWGHNDAAGGTSGSGFFVDSVHMHWMHELSEKTRVTVNKAMGFNGPAANNAPNAAAVGGAFFFNNQTRLAGAGAAAGFNLAVNEAYLDWTGYEHVTFRIGMFRTPFSMENSWERFNMHSFHYSAAYTFMHNRNMTYDLGLMAIIDGMFPGTLEFAILDGRGNRTEGAAPDGISPAYALRYHNKLELDGMNLTPMVSALLSRVDGGPRDLGISVGAMWDMGMLWANVEFLRITAASTRGAATPKAIGQSIIIEPGVNMGDLGLSLKVDLAKAQAAAATVATNTINLALALTKKYGDDMRIRLVAQKTDATNKTGAPITDVRLMFGSDW